MARRGTARSQDEVRLQDLEDAAIDIVDVPAAVVCAICGDPDCPGCADLEEHTQNSGVVAIVPWERPGGLPSRLWTTARLTTVAPEAFFGSLPDGELATPLRFALVAEFVAVIGLVGTLTPLLALAAPELFGTIWSDPTTRGVLLRAVAAGIPTLAAAMVLLHAAHGFGMALGARQLGAKPRWSRAVRFGLYACGWDLVTLPLGWLTLLVTEGPRAALGAVPAAITVPTRAARAFVEKVYGSDPRLQSRARVMGFVVVMAVLGVLVAATVAGIVL